MTNCINCGSPIQGKADRCANCGYVAPKREPASIAPVPVVRPTAKVEPAAERRARPVSMGAAAPTPGLGVVRQVSVLDQPRSGGCLRAAGALLAGALVLVVIVQSMDEIISRALPFLVIGVLLYALLSWVGIGAVLGRMFLGGAGLAAGAALRGAGGRQRTNPMLVFTISPADGRSDRLLDVRLPGHCEGIGVGDTVQVQGYRWWGRLEAIWVRNHTRGRLFMRAGLVGNIINAVFIAVLIIMLIGLTSGATSAS